MADARCQPLASFFLRISPVFWNTLGCMAEQVTPISRAISDILAGAYKKKRVTQDEIAERANMSIWTVQKKLRGRSPVTATDLVVLAQAIGVDPGRVLTEALDDLTEEERAQEGILASEGVVSIADQRRKKKPSEMTEEELDAFEGESAANTDTELGHDEPDPT